MLNGGFEVWVKRWEIHNRLTRDNPEALRHPKHPLAIQGRAKDPVFLDFQIYGY
jgi:hypothetical protein